MVPAMQANTETSIDPKARLHFTCRLARSERGVAFRRHGSCFEPPGTDTQNGRLS